MVKDPFQMLQCLSQHLHSYEQTLEASSRNAMTTTAIVAAATATPAAHVVNLPPPLPQRELFSGGPLVSAVGLGAWPLAGAHGPVGKNDGIAAVQRFVLEDNVSADWATSLAQALKEASSSPQVSLRINLLSFLLVTLGCRGLGMH